jgi:hypothetical protein
MAEATQITFKYSELVELMIKKQGIHEGIWGLFVNFGLAASNIGPTETNISPAAIVGVIGIGLQKFEKESNIAVDAEKVNPLVSENANK